MLQVTLNIMLRTHTKDYMVLLSWVKNNNVGEMLYQQVTPNHTKRCSYNKYDI